jgi:hypothetical protein
MQGKNKNNELHDLLMLETSIYSKMYELGLCDIADRDGSYIIRLETPGIPLSKFINSMNIIWPEIKIEFIDNKFPHEILLVPEIDDANVEHSRDFSLTESLKFTYNPRLISSISNFIDLVLLEWFNFVYKKFLKIYRIENFNGGKLPLKWPHDIHLHRVRNSIGKAVMDLFLKLDWDSFNSSHSDFCSIILANDISNFEYIEDETMKEIWETNIAMHPILNMARAKYKK